MLLNGSEILIECLKEQGVDTIFGYPGGAVLNIYDALYKHQNEITHILTSHEQGAAHMADGYARATGKVGVCIATSGPGATNLVTGIATAYMDSVPMVAITGQVPTALLGKDSFQEVDITGITLPITKHNFIVKKVDDLADIIRRAFYIAKEGRPGPVLVDICKDVTAAIFEYEKKEKAEIPKREIGACENSLNKLAMLIDTAKQPIILTGGGTVIADASNELFALSQKASIPVCSTLMGISGFDNTSELFTGLLGMHGTKASNMAVHNCDLFIAIGARFSDRVTSDVKKFAKNANIIHIDGDEAEIGKNVCADVSLTGNLKLILERLCQLISKVDRSDWILKISHWKKEYPYKDNCSGDLTPKYVLEKIHQKTNGEAIITTEVGQNQIWAAQFFKYTKPRSFISSGGLGTMGYGLGASIGASFGMPNKRVINIAGDGSFQMNMNELATAKAYNVPIIQVVLNNHVLGMVRQWQNLFYEKRFSHTTLNRGTDFIALAKAFGIDAFNATNEKEFDYAIEKALMYKKPIFINCEIKSDEMVYPIVPPGKPINEIIMD